MLTILGLSFWTLSFDRFYSDDFLYWSCILGTFPHMSLLKMAPSMTLEIAAEAWGLGKGAATKVRTSGGVSEGQRSLLGLESRTACKKLRGK